MWSGLYGPAGSKLLIVETGCAPTLFAVSLRMCAFSLFPACLPCPAAAAGSHGNAGDAILIDVDDEEDGPAAGGPGGGGVGDGDGDDEPPPSAFTTLVTAMKTRFLRDSEE